MYMNENRDSLDVPSDKALQGSPVASRTSPGITLISQLMALVRDNLKSLVREAVLEAMHGDKREDRLLDAEEAAKSLAVSEDWLYRNAKNLPFARKLGPKALRFSQRGMEKWIATRKTF
jgi:predicted DNA-binding transcriptional regulator AlpA